MDIGSAVKFPTEDEKWIAKVVIGGILSIIPIVNLLVTGFYLKTMEKAIKGSPGMPEWEGWGELFVKGLLATIICFIYLLIPLIVVTVAVVMVGGLASTVTADTFPNIFAMFSAIIIGGILAIIFGFFIPMALAMYVASGSVGNAFKPGELISRIKSVLGDYILAYVVIFVLMVVLSLISAIPLLGWIIAIFGGFYIGVVAMNIFGNLYVASNA
ncbi:MAG: conserved hypothetical protein, membrane [Candidatus Syntrophoarchaeum caldarius]|uniref:Uncharacterized protein n=1 Tax=Candidatus Syntropharchaeum caldarium TaxID=1838285 RepID=A0A1F2PCU7_9EURY|nr:MAG: conserved hypothetical protein, membrane [Candidatus Syntrophoarchaeum caldarius]